MGSGVALAKPINVGLLGIGTVGGGTFTVLQRNQEEIGRRAGCAITMKMVADKDLDKVRSIVGERAIVTADAYDVVDNRDIDIVVELIGGTTIAKELVLKAIANGKHVVTANKALLAQHGNEIFAAAQKHGVMVAFEAAVAGGIPIIKALREGLTANRIEWIAGIINGTSNFILSEMRDKGASFGDVLKEAQVRATPKPTRRSISRAWTPRTSSPSWRPSVSAFRCSSGRPTPKAFRSSRAKTSATPRSWATASSCSASPSAKQGHRAARASDADSRARLIANVEGVMNAILVKGDAVGQTMYYGAGAGAEPTASAVVADLVDVARMLTADPEHRVPHLAFQPGQLANTPILPMGEVETSYYLRMRVHDKPGVLADITRILADSRHLDRCDGAEGAARRRGPGRHHHADAPDGREARQRGAREDRSAAGRCGQGHAHSARGIELEAAGRSQRAGVSGSRACGLAAYGQKD